MGFFVGAPRNIQAQAPAMSLMGSVQSDAKVPLAGAAITVIHLPSGVRHAVASDGAGRFVVANLLGGGPYLIRVGEGGYRSQTVENIFLENGKTTNFTVMLSKLGEKHNKSLSRRVHEQPGHTLALAPEAVLGGPVLMTTLRKSRSRAGRSASSTPVDGAPATTAPATTAPATTAPATTALATTALATTTPATTTPATTAPATTAPATMPAPVSPTPTAAAVITPSMLPVVASAPVPDSTPRPARYATTYPTHRPTKRVTDIIVPGRYDAKSGNYIYDTGKTTTLKLTGGRVVTGVGSNSTESYLYHFLADPQVQVDTVDLTKGWYNFDRVYFEAGKANLTHESIGQLRNVATILQAYPKARIKLGGYTDSTGTYNVNKQLSEARARTAWVSLVEMGISPSRIDARGYGRNYAIAANDSEEGRAKNRRLSVKVLEK